MSTPAYYQTPHGDLYDLFVARWGIETVQSHLLMASIEYLWRAQLKGQFAADLHKTEGVLTRLLDLSEAQKPVTPPFDGHKSLEEMARILRTCGWHVAAPDALSAVATPDPLAPVEPPSETVMAHCLRADTTQNRAGLPTGIRRLLTEVGIDPYAPYADHAAVLAALWPDRWPDTTQGATHG